MTPHACCAWSATPAASASPSTRTPSSSPGPRSKAARRRPSRAGARAPETVALAAARNPEAAEPARHWLRELRHVRLEIDGSDVLAAGVPEGPEVGRALAAARTAKLDGTADGRQAELAAALAAIGRE